MEKTDLLVQIYRILPELIGEAVSLPIVELDDHDDQLEGAGKPPITPNPDMSPKQWSELYYLLKGKLGNEDLYWQVFDPTRDTEAIHGSLAGDIEEIYRDLKEGLVLLEQPHLAPPEDIIWEWRFGFFSHWGKHAIDALRTIHFLLEGKLS